MTRSLRSLHLWWRGKAYNPPLPEKNITLLQDLIKDAYFYESETGTRVVVSKEIYERIKSALTS
jgi:hypothetical protein